MCAFCRSKPAFRDPRGGARKGAGRKRKTPQSTTASTSTALSAPEASENVYQLQQDDEEDESEEEVPLVRSRKRVRSEIQLEPHSAPSTSSSLNESPSDLMLPTSLLSAGASSTSESRATPAVQLATTINTTTPEVVPESLSSPAPMSAVAPISIASPVLSEASLNAESFNTTPGPPPPLTTDAINSTITASSPAPTSDPIPTTNQAIAQLPSESTSQERNSLAPLLTPNPVQRHSSVDSETGFSASLNIAPADTPVPDSGEKDGDAFVDVVGESYDDAEPEILEGCHKLYIEAVISDLKERGPNNQTKEIAPKFKRMFATGQMIYHPDERCRALRSHMRNFGKADPSFFYHPKVVLWIVDEVFPWVT